ncbi:MAG TPA: hypothetical protein VM253_10310, partial [Candidatus Limnocylindrales bacterium]|nr:hypothetical protein [Candidatus Limnocylindrales bacterium]
RHKTSRRFGVDIYGTGGASLQRRIGTPPGGLRAGRRRRASVYATQLVEKQKASAQLPAVIDERRSSRPAPAWLEPHGDRGGRVVRLPERAEIDVPVDEAQIVGFYSR